MNWPFVPIDHLEQCLILLGTALIPMRRANSSPNTPLLWHILRTAHCFPPSLSHRMAFSLLCEAGSFGSERLQSGFWLLTTPDALAQHRRQCEREVWMCMLQGSCPSPPLLAPTTTCPPVSLGERGTLGLQTQTNQPPPTSPGHPWLPPALHKGGIWQC